MFGLAIISSGLFEILSTVSKFYVTINLDFNIKRSIMNINVKKQITGFFVYIIGFSGSGKLSTAIELSSMIDALIVNSNLSRDTQVCSIYNDAFRRGCVSKNVEDRMYEIAQVMLQAIEAYPVSSKNYIFTDELVKNNDHDMRMYNLVVKLSEKVNAKILPVVLRCNFLTLQKRIELKQERGNKRLAHTNNMRRGDLFVPPNSMEIENSNKSVREVAQEIVSGIYKIVE